MRELISLVLIRAGFVVRTASSGSEAVRIASGASLALMLLELQLPDMSGIDILRALRENAIRVPPFLLVSAFLTPRIVVEAMRLGAVNILEKPFAVDDLVATVQLAFDERVARSIGAPDGALHDRAPHPGSAAERWAIGVVRACESDDFVSADVRSGAVRTIVGRLGNRSVGIGDFLSLSETLRWLVKTSKPLTVMDFTAYIDLRGSSARRAIPWHGRAFDAIIAEMEAVVSGGRRPSELEVASAVGITACQLGRILRRESDLGFREWRIVLVMMAASHHLMRSDVNISEIAYALGYEHPSQFDREFHRWFGLNPTNFRRILAAALTA